jgi:hypothetical protein
MEEWRVIRSELVNAGRLIVTYLAANGPGRRCSPSVAAGTAAILVRRTSKAGTGRAEYIEQREGIYRLSRRSGLQIHVFPLHPVRLVGSGDGLADLLVRAAGITELLAKS